MIYKQYKQFLLILLLAWYPLYNVLSQKTADYKDINNAYQKGVGLYQKEKYSAAQELFRQAIDDYDNIYTEYKSNATYYHAMCAVHLYHKNAEYLTEKFINKYPGSQKVVDAKMQMANTYYDQDNYEKAIEWFQTINPHRISKARKAEYYFKSGYAFFNLEQYDTARVLLYEIINKDTKYTSPAIYYYSHIAYEQENYQTSLDGFLKLTDDPTFSRIVPYYITQIYYIQKKYDKIIEYAPPLVDSLITNRKAEVSRIIGDAYYRNNEYVLAARYYNFYAKNTGDISNKDQYRIAYSYYKLEEYEKAAEIFERIENPDSTFAQNIMYHLGDCYIQTNQKDKARMAFESASEMDYNPEIKKNALFNYAKITYELSYSPFNNAINALNKYINLYPDDKNTEEAFNYLVLSYLSTNNYKDALESIRKIEKKNEDMEKAYQRIAYFRGLELFKNLAFSEAIDLFNESLDYKQYDHLVKAKAYYWKGEALYRTENYKDAINNYKEFVGFTGVFALDIYRNAHYNLGYAYFKLKEYNDAATWFRKFINLEKASGSKRLADAYNRTGDCFFVLSNYWQAIDFYNEAVKLKTMNPDYSLFQKAFSLGLLAKNEDKINGLQQLLKQYPNSTYTDNALFELGKTLVDVQKPDSAIRCYLKLVKEYPSSGYVVKAHVQLGLVYYNMNKNEEALSHFKKVIEQYPHSEESKNALTGIKNIYLDMDNVNAYFEYVNNLDNYTEVTISGKDSLLYTSAENVYMKGNCDKAIQLFDDYISQYPTGSYILNAHYYRANCHYKNNNYDQALSSFNFVIDKTKNTFTEEALLSAAEICYMQNDYEKALQHYQKLAKVADKKKNIAIAQKGRLRCHFELKDYQKTLDLANKMLPGIISEELNREIIYMMGVSNYKLEKPTASLENFRELSGEASSREGAEAKYYVIKILFEQKQYDDAKKEVFDFIDKNTPHRYWLAKSFLLLADIFVEEGEKFQAIQTLKSLIENYENQDDGIIKEAKSKLTALEKDKETINNENIHKPEEQ